MRANGSPAGATATAYTYDAGERTASTQVGASGTQSVMHCADASDSPAWTSAGVSWTVLAAGLDGRLSVTATSATGTLAAAVSELQVTDLHGDTVATAAVPATGSITALDAATSAYDEFGAVIAGTTSQGTYGWLAAQKRATSGDVVLMGARAYNPATGRFLQVDPVAGGSANAYDYVYQDPVNKFDLDGRCWGMQWKCWKHKVKTAASAAAFAACVAASAAACALIGLASAATTAAIDNNGRHGNFTRDFLIGSAFALGGAGLGMYVGKAYEAMGPRGATLFRTLRSARMTRARNAVFGPYRYHWTYYKTQTGLGIVGMGLADLA